MNEYVWKPLAELELNFFKLKHLRINCLCSRAFVRSNYRVGNWKKLFNERWSQFEMKEETETTACVQYELREHNIGSQCFKEQEDEAVSCYCSASHYSTEDYESVVQSTTDQFNPCKDQFLVYSLQNSDSGADLSDHFTEKTCKNSESAKKYNIHPNSEFEFAWEKYWSENGESIIWKSWIEKYGAYINPSYLEQNSLCENLNGNFNDVMDEENVSESCSKAKSNKGSVIHSSIEVTLPTSSDDSSGPSSTPSSSSKEEICTEADIWWRKVWKEHYEDQYSSCYQTFLYNYDKGTKAEILEAKINEVEETMEEVVEKINSDHEKSKKGSTFKSQQYMNSVGYILQNPDKATLDSEQSSRNELKCTRDNNQMPEITKDTLISSRGSDRLKRHLEISDDTFDESEKVESKSRKKFTKKASQKMKALRKKEKAKKTDVKQALALMGFCFKVDSDEIQSGYVTYWKKNIRGLNTRLKLFDNKPKMHLFFDDDGNPFESDQNESVDIVQPVEEDCDELEDDFTKSEENIAESLPCEANFSSMENGVDAINDNRKQKRRKRKKRKKYESLPQEIVDNKNLLKYWHRRHKLFSKFDEGIKLDAESWFSVTPEKLAQYHAERCRCDVIVDAFCGAGGNSIQFAFTCERVIAIDIDPYKIEIAKNNARIYGVEERIEFIIGDFTKMASKLQADVVFLSPPWGGPGYMKDDAYTLDNILPSLGGEGLFQIASAVAENVAYFLPKNACANDLVLLSGPGGEIEIEQNFMDLRLHSITAYFGSLIMDPDDPYIISV